MGAVTNFSADSLQFSAQAGMVDGSRAVVRSVQRLLGAALVLAASGLWLTPGSNFGSDVMLFKVGLSALSVMLGASLMLSGQKPALPEIQIDTLRRELRLVRPRTVGAQRVLQRCSFGDLGRVERIGRNFHFWDGRGNFIVDVHIAERRVVDNLTFSLRDSGLAI
tara:strand:- start:903 stop:1397 length:495 start_codon:yes stop_codon:yes gene_type:complete